MAFTTTPRSTFPAGVTVSFIPNANNTPVVWLVQSICAINGVVDVSAETVPWQFWNPVVQNGGPGGYRGGNGGTAASAGIGPGAGNVGVSMSGNASFGAIGGVYSNQFQQESPGSAYGNAFLLPLLGGSGGGGKGPGGYGQQGGQGPGGGGGGAILIAASGAIIVNGSIAANGSRGGNSAVVYQNYPYGGSGAGSGGGVRLVASHVAGSGSIAANGGGCYASDGRGGAVSLSSAGAGRVRFDSTDNTFSGSISGAFTQGFQPIIIPVPGQGVQLAVASVGGIAVSANPSGVLVTPDAILAAQQVNPVPIVVRCSNLPLNTPVTVSVRPANGSVVSAVGYNNTGTLSNSTATVLVNMPRGGGLIYATAATGN